MTKGHLALNHKARFAAILDGDKTAVNAADDRQELIEQMSDWGYSLKRGDYAVVERDVEWSDRCVWCSRLEGT